MRVDFLVEGHVDALMAARILEYCEHEPGTAYGKKGWNYIAQKIAAFDKSVGLTGLLTLVDFMDTGARCPSDVVRDWLPNRAQTHVFRLVVREIESWILADRNGIADFLCVPVAKIPFNPDTVLDPKLTLVNLARGSRSKSIKYSLAPRLGQAASEGPLYSTELGRFVAEKWSPDAARLCSDSLDRCIFRLNQIHTNKNDEV